MKHRRHILRLLIATPLAACARALPEPTPTSPPPPQPTSTPSQSPSPSLPPQAQASFESAPQARPLIPHEIGISLPEYSGPAQLRLFDARQRQTAAIDFFINAGQSSQSPMPRGALGPQRAELWVAGTLVGQQDAIFSLDAETSISTGQAHIDELYPRIRAMLQQCVLEYTLDGQHVRGYRSPDNPLLWLRDHTYQARGFRYIEHDMTSLIDAFQRAQNPDGSLPDWLANQAQGVLKPGRKQVEADLEFLFVQAVVEAWQVTGDDAWLAQHLDAMRRALSYCMTDPLRWDAQHGLIKRPYTIDMWDFAYGPSTLDPSNGKPAPRHWIDDQTIWGIFHGDNTGLASALNLLALAEEQLGHTAEALHHRGQADQIMSNVRKLSWNGRFFTHFVPLSAFEPVGVDASAQLSLSNAYALNRQVLRERQALTIIDEYYQRGQAQDATIFSEWYSIDPPFPAGSYGLAGRPGEKPGEYVNGGLMPLVGGELARGAFRYGAASYGFAILHRYHFLISSTGTSYLWYYPNGSPGISGVDTLPTDGWGASAMLAALIEGAAGIEGRGVGYDSLRLSPAWAADETMRQVHVSARYAASQSYSAYQWVREPQRIVLLFTSSGQATQLRLLLPSGQKKIRAALLDGQPIDYEIENLSSSRYIVVSAPQGFGVAEITFEE